MGSKKKIRSSEHSANTRELLFSITKDDLDIQTFHAGGPGGQHQNKSDTGVRIIHKASGARGESREDRSQLRNKQAAFRRMTEHPKFKAWVNLQIHAAGESPMQKVERDMRPENIKIEYFDGQQWNYT